MQIYSCEISDMKVSLFCNGLDNIVAKSSYPFEKDSDYSDSDVLLLLSAKEDKAAISLLDSFSSCGVTAGLVIALYSEAPTSCRDVIDMEILSSESELPSALSSVLSLLDYYTYINSVDIGYELSDFGSAVYKNGGAVSSLSDTVDSVARLLSKREKAVLLLNAPEDVWISELDSFASLLSEKVPETDVIFSAVRKEGKPFGYSLFLSE